MMEMVKVSNELSDDLLVIGHELLFEESPESRNPG
mgnify:CR=1 FL=1